MRLLVILNEGFQNVSFYRVGVNNKLVKLIQFSLTKLSYKLMVVTTLTSETVFDGLLMHDLMAKRLARRTEDHRRSPVPVPPKTNFSIMFTLPVKSTGV